MSRDCLEPKAAKESDTPDINNLMMNVNAIQFDEDELEIAHVVNDQRYMNMLRDTGAQGHVAPATEEHKNNTKNLGTVHHPMRYIINTYHRVHSKFTPVTMLWPEHCSAISMFIESNRKSGN